MYQALYRKYRPRRFSDVVGQEHITQTLKSQVTAERLTHAYLFIGTRGTGKTTCAKILSRAVNCLNPKDGNPCNECLSCKGIEDGTILDVMEIDAASNRKIDDVRDIRDEAIYTPSSVKKRVYILDEVHMLTTEAVNALLKILEEPPEHVVFILATTELHKVPATIQSRCQKYAFRRLSVEEISKRLIYIAESEAITLTPDAAQRLAMLADGSMRDAVSLLDQCATDKKIDSDHVLSTLGLASKQHLVEIIGAVADKQIIKILDITDKLYKDGKDMAALLNELTGIIRDILVVSLSPNLSLLSSGLTPEELKTLAKRLTSEQLYHCLDTAKNAALSMPHTGVTKLMLEMCLIRMCDEKLSESSAAVLARLSNLENGVTVMSKPPETNRKQDNPVMQPTEPEIEPNIVTEAIQETEPEEPETIQVIQTDSEDDDAANTDTDLSTDIPQQAATGNIIDDLTSNISDESLRIYFNDRETVWAHFDDGLLTINMTNVFSANMVRDQFMDTLQSAACKTFNRDVNVQIKIVEKSKNADKQNKLDNLKAFGDIVKVE